MVAVSAIIWGFVGIIMLILGAVWAYADSSEYQNANYILSVIIIMLILGAVCAYADYSEDQNANYTLSVITILTGLVGIAISLYVAGVY